MLFCAEPSPIPPPPPKNGAHERPQAEETILEVWINGIRSGGTVLMLRMDRELWADRADLVEWRFDVESFPFRTHNGRSYVPLDRIKGLSYRIDPRKLQLRIEAEASLFLPSYFENLPDTIHTAQTDTGAFFNYDVLMQRDRLHSDSSMVGEIGLFGTEGLLLGNFFYRNGIDGSEWVRLDTAYRKDFPETLHTLSVGDAITRSASLWGGAVRFGGIQWGTNFETQPGLITAPLFRFEGEAILPSTVDLYINNLLQTRREVPAGPFSIDYPPLLSGAGETRAVVTDLMGREQVIVGSFYASPRLLREGLDEYSLEAGFVRENYAIRSDDYGRFIGAATYRRGLTDSLTAEAHGEFSEETQTAGVGGTWMVENVGVLSTAAAASASEEGSGAMGLIGFDRAGGGISVGGSLKAATDKFAQFGTSVLFDHPRLEGRINASLFLSGIGSFSTHYTRRDYRDRDDLSLLGLGYSGSWKEIGSLHMSAHHTLSPASDYSFLIHLSRSFGDRQTGSIGVSGDDGGTSQTISLKKSLPTGPGDGYSLIKEYGRDPRLEALYEWQNDYGTYSAGFSRTDGSTLWRAAAAGGVAALNKELFFSRAIRQSFAVVNTGEYSDITVYKDNLPAGKTGKNKTLLIPGLRPYEKNPIGIEQSDLPLDSSFDAVTIDAVPAYRSGVVVSFPLEKVRRAIITLTSPDGKPVPSGSLVEIDGKAKNLRAGRGGMIYLEGLKKQSIVRIFWKGSSCTFPVEFPETDDPMPDLGDFVCRLDPFPLAPSSAEESDAEAHPITLTHPAEAAAQGAIASSDGYWFFPRTMKPRSGDLVAPDPAIYQTHQRALIHVLMPDGSDAPEGSALRIVGKSHIFRIGRAGKAYLEGLEEWNLLELRDEDKSCRFVLHYPATGDPLPILGTFKCKGDTGETGR